MAEDQARKVYDKMLKIEEEFGDLFTGLFVHLHRFHNYRTPYFIFEKLLNKLEEIDKILQAVVHQGL